MTMAWLATIAVGVGIYFSPPRPHLAEGEIVDLLATPTNDGLVVVWTDGTIAGYEFATGAERWSSWLPGRSVSGERLAVTEGAEPELVYLYMDEKLAPRVARYDVDGRRAPRISRVGDIPSGLLSIAAVAGDRLLIHDNGQDTIHECARDGTVRRQFEVPGCMMGAVFAPQYGTLVTFHSDRYVIGHDICGGERWSQRREFMEPRGRYGDTIVAMDTETPSIVGLSADDGRVLWRFAYHAEEQIGNLLPDGTLVISRDANLLLVRRHIDGSPAVAVQHPGPARVVLSRDATRIACLPQAEVDSDHVMRRPSSAITICDARTGHKVGAWTPRKPERPTTPETSDQPVVRQQPAPTSQPSAQTVAPRLVEQFPGELEEIFPSTRWFALMVGDRVVALVTTDGDQIDSVLLLSADRRHTVVVNARDGYFPGSIMVTDERDAENPYTISDNDADGVPDRKMTGLPRSFKVFELDSINWRPKVRAKDAATTQPSFEQP